MGAPGGRFAWASGLGPQEEPGAEFCEHILGPIHLPGPDPLVVTYSRESLSLGNRGVKTLGRMVG